MLRSLGSSACLALCSIGFAQAPAGFSLHTLPVNVAGGLDLAPTGEAIVFDGSRVVLVDRAHGTPTRVLYTPPGSVFGAFVRTDARRGVVYFGESSGGTLTEIPLHGGASRSIGTLAFPFDCAIDPHGLIVLSADPTFSGTNTLFALDPHTGALDPLVRVPGASGPVVFDDHGDLYYVTQSSAFPPPPGASDVLRFDAARLRTALGPGELGPHHAHVVATGLDGGFRARFAGDGALYVTDGPRVHRVAPSGTHGVFFEEAPGTFLTYLAFDPGDTRPFRAYAPSSGGTLLVSASDFVARMVLHALTPQRPALVQSPANPIPQGHVSYGLELGPPHGAFFPLVSAHRVSHEITWNLPEPVFLALLPNDVLILPPVALDGRGHGTISLSTVGAHVGGLVLHWQGLVLDVHTSIVGSSNPVEAVLH